MLSELRAHAWAYPALEVVHIVGIALLLGNLVALGEIRVWGGAAALPVKALGGCRSASRWAASRWPPPAPACSCSPPSPPNCSPTAASY